MARTHLTKNQVSYPWNDAYANAVKAKHDEHDHALDALEGGTTSSVVTIHPARGASTANVANLAAFTVANDGITFVAGERVFLKDQSTVAQNGIYVVGTVGGGTAALTRATDWDEAAEIKPNTFVAVAEGTAGAGTIWQLTGDYPVVVGTSHQHFTQIRNATQADARLALTTTPGGASYVGVFDNAGIYTATTVEAALAEVKVLADASVGAVKRTVTVAEASLSGASQAVNIGAILPANANVFMHEIIVNTQGVLAGNDLTITIGGTDADAIVASTDLDALAAGSYQGTLGVHPRGSFGGEQLVATFAAADLASLSAGNWTINVWYFVLA